MARFFDLVKAMREAQKDYIAKRTTGALRRSKELERKVDLAIERQGHPDLPYVFPGDQEFHADEQEGE